MRGILDNKKGEGSDLMSLIIWAVVAAIAAIVVLYFFTDVFDFIGGKKDQIPGGALETVIQGCKISATTLDGLTGDYCLVFREVSDTQFISCQDNRVTNILAQQGVVPLDCSGLASAIAEAKKEVCKNISPGKKDKVKVDGETCTTIDARNISPTITVTVSQGVSNRQSQTIEGIIYTIEAIKVEQNQATIKISTRVEDLEVSDEQVIQKSNARGVEFGLGFFNGDVTGHDFNVRILSINTATVPNKVTLEIKVVIP